MLHIPSKNIPEEAVKMIGFIKFQPLSGYLLVFPTTTITPSGDWTKDFRTRIQNQPLIFYFETESS